MMLQEPLLNFSITVSCSFWVRPTKLKEKDRYLVSGKGYEKKTEFIQVHCGMCTVSVNEPNKKILAENNFLICLGES